MKKRDGKVAAVPDMECITARAAERNLPMRRVRLPPRSKGFFVTAYIISLRGVVVLVYYLTFKGEL